MHERDARINSRARITGGYQEAAFSGTKILAEPQLHRWAATLDEYQVGLKALAQLQSAQAWSMGQSVTTVLDTPVMVRLAQQVIEHSSLDTISNVSDSAQT